MRHHSWDGCGWWSWLWLVALAVAGGPLAPLAGVLRPLIGTVVVIPELFLCFLLHIGA